jgi:hypothetical protein
MQQVDSISQNNTVSNLILCILGIEGEHWESLVNTLPPPPGLPHISTYQ